MAQSEEYSICLLYTSKPLPSRKVNSPVPLVDCFIAPCQEGCPIHQDITRYLQLAGEGKHEEALKVILNKNPLPFITGTICAHNCMSKCTRNFYETAVNILSLIHISLVSQRTCGSHLQSLLSTDTVLAEQVGVSFL